MEQLYCQNCGNTKLVMYDGRYCCSYCGSEYFFPLHSKYGEALADKLEDAKTQELLRYYKRAEEDYQKLAHTYPRSFDVWRSFMEFMMREYERVLKCEGRLARLRNSREQDKSKQSLITRPIQNEIKEYYRNALLLGNEVEKKELRSEYFEWVFALTGKIRDGSLLFDASVAELGVSDRTEEIVAELIRQARSQASGFPSCMFQIGRTYLQVDRLEDAYLPYQYQLYAYQEAPTEEQLRRYQSRKQCPFCGGTRFRLLSMKCVNCNRTRDELIRPRQLVADLDEPEHAMEQKTGLFDTVFSMFFGDVSD